MYIKISKTDCQNIVNQNLRGGGNSELEIALAKKCLSLYDRLGEINNEQNAYFHAIYSSYRTFEKAAGERLKQKMAADLDSASKSHFAAAVKLDGQLKEMMDGISKDKD